MNDTPNKKIVIIAGEGDYPLFVYNYLRREKIEIQAYIIEKPVQRGIFLRRRMKTLGILHVIGQILFRAIIVNHLKRKSKNRIAAIHTRAGLHNDMPEKEKIIRVPSINSNHCLKKLQEIDPKLILVIDTRIISEKILNGTNGKLINIHAGITPQYRGWHGAYWALVKKDKQHCGVTIHLVDEGIDTGGILYQSTIDPTEMDNYYTYPFLQLEKALPLVKKAIKDVIDDSINIKQISNSTPSNLYSHPTIWAYIYNFVFRGVR